MALLQNKSINAQYPIRQYCGATTGTRSMYGDKLQTNLNKYVGYANLDPKYSDPNGYTPGTTWLPNRVTGGLAAYFGAGGVGSVSNSNLAGGKNADASISGSGAIIDAPLAALTFAISTILSSGDLTSDIKGVVNIYSDIAGTSDVTSSLSALKDLLSTLVGSSSISGDLAGVLDAEAIINGAASVDALVSGLIDITSTLLGAGSVDPTIMALVNANASLSGYSSLQSSLESLGNMVAAVLSTGSVSGADMRAKAYMSADVTPFTDLSPQNLAAAVWNTLASELNSPGSMGDYVNKILLIEKIMRNKTVTDPVSGTLTVYDDDGTTILFEGDLFEDADGIQPYRGQGAERRERIV